LGHRLGDRYLLPRLLNHLAEIRISQQRIAEATELLDEAGDLLEGLIANAHSPRIKSRLVGAMDEIFLARIRLEGGHGKDPSRMFELIEHARGRVLADLLLGTPISDATKRADFQETEKRISRLQVRLYNVKGRSARKELLEEIFAAETTLAPAASELFRRAQSSTPRRPSALKELQAVLYGDELVLEFALADPVSYCLAVRLESAKIYALDSKTALQQRITS
jgi:hypothetical protein